MAKAAKPKNPNDATFRNVNALKKRVAALEQVLLYKSDGESFAQTFARLNLNAPDKHEVPPSDDY